jgi:hypothetical protein
MLFLPRYWFHSVDSVDEINVNLNWVFASKRAPVPSRIARREDELSWIRRRLDGPRSRVFGSPGGTSAGPAPRGGVGVAAGLARAVKELAALPLAAGRLTAFARTYASMQAHRRRAMVRIGPARR